mgnify:CR=1
WQKPLDNSYFFKKAHAFGYAHAIVLQMNLLVTLRTNCKVRLFTRFLATLSRLVTGPNSIVTSFVAIVFKKGLSSANSLSIKMLIGI